MISPGRLSTCRARPQWPRPLPNSRIVQPTGLLLQHLRQRLKVFIRIVFNLSRWGYREPDSRETALAHQFKRFRACLFRHTEIIDAAGRASSRRAGSTAAGHHRLLTSSLKERVLSGLQIGRERDLVGSDRHMLGLKRDLFVLLNTRLAGGHAAERAYLKFTAIAFLLQPDEYIVGCANPIRHIEVKLRLTVLHAIL